MSDSNFCHLHCHTEYSLLDGILRRSDLLDRVKEWNAPAACITEHGNIYHMLDTAKQAQEKEVPLIIGCEFYMANQSRTLGKGYWKKGQRHTYHLILLAKNRTGYDNLVALLTEANTTGFYYKPRIDRELLSQYSEGLICSSACLAGEFAQAVVTDNNYTDVARWYQNLFGEDYYLELMLTGVDGTELHKEQTKVNKQVLVCAQDLGIPTIATTDVHYLNEKDAYSHDVSVCVATNRKVDEERDHDDDKSAELRYLPSKAYYLKHRDEMAMLGFPEEALDNTVNIVKKCDLDYGFNFKSSIVVPDICKGADSMERLRIICKSNWDAKVPKDIKSQLIYKQRLAHELVVIEELGFANYFLVIEDVIRYAREELKAFIGPGRGCLHPDTNILTAEGFKKIVDVSINDKVLSIDGTYRRVLKTWEYACNENLMCIKSYYGNGGGIKLTRDHRVWCIPTYKTAAGIYKDISEPMWMPAGALQVGYRVFLPNFNEVRSGITSYDGLELTEEVLWLLGYWVGDGWIQSKKGCHRIGFCFNYTTKLHCADRIESILRLLDIKYSPRRQISDKNSFQIVINSKSWCTRFKKLFSGYRISHSKTLPIFFRELNNQQLTILLDGYMSADGSDNDKLTACTVSENLAYEIKEIALMLGIPCAIRSEEARDDPRGYDSSDTWYLNFARLDRTFVKSDNNGYWMLVRELSEIRDGGGCKVYDLTIDGEPNFCTDSMLVHNSAAGSLVVYLLDITRVIDPIKYGLSFERFLNRDRVSMPDIDFDVEQRYRQALIEYVRGKYGDENVGHIGTFTYMKARSCIDRVGAVLRVPYVNIREASKKIPEHEVGWDVSDAIEYIKDLKEYMDNINPNWLKHCLAIEGLPKNIGCHASGILIADKPISSYMPMARTGSAAKLKMVTQMDMWEVEGIGLLKFDFLGLNTLDVISDCCKSVGLDPYAIPLNDLKTYKLICRGTTLGVFQLEKKKFQTFCKRMKPMNFEQVIALNALFRPAALDSGTADIYIDCKHGDRKIEYYDQTVEDLLSSTFGICLYQEDWMNVSKIMAGYSGTEADILRKIIGKKLLKEMDEEEGKFKQGLIDNGYAHLADRMWNDLKAAGRYCVTGNTKIMLADGTYCDMIDLVRNKYHGQVMSFDNEFDVVPETIIDWHDVGKYDVYNIKLKNGKNIECTGNHEFPTDRGKLTIEEGLEVGDSLILSNKVIDIPNTSNLHNYEIIYLAHMIAEGYLRTRKYKSGNILQRPVFVNRCSEMLNDFANAICAFPNSSYNEVKRNTRTGVVTQLVGCPKESRPFIKYSPTDLILSLGCDVLSTEKFIPDEILKLSNDELALFVSRLWCGGGYIYFGKKGSISIGYSSKSKKLIEQICLILTTRFGISATFRVQKGKRLSTYINDNSDVKNHKTTNKIIYVAIISDRTDCSKFADIFGSFFIGKKKELLKKVLDVGVAENGQKSDILGYKNYKDNSIVVKAIHPGKKEKHFINRVTLSKLRIGGIIDNLNIRFSPIVSIENIGKQSAYCITVNNNHSMIANGILSYQSWNRSHSAAYGWLTYASAYLKVNYPVEYLCSLMNHPAGHNTATERIAALINDARDFDIGILPPDINLSGAGFTVHDGQILYGLSGIKGVGKAALEALMAAREEGEFKDFKDFFVRVPLRHCNAAVKKALVGAGCFDMMGLSRGALIHNIADITKQLKRKKPDHKMIDDMISQQYPLTLRAKLKLEQDLMGMRISGSYLDIYKDINTLFGKYSWPLSEIMDRDIGTRLISLMYVVRRHEHITKRTGNKMGFVDVDDGTAQIDTICFPKAWDANSKYIQPDNLVVLEGSVIDDQMNNSKKLEIIAVHPAEPHIFLGSLSFVPKDNLSSVAHKILTKTLINQSESFVISGGSDELITFEANRVELTPGLYNLIKGAAEDGSIGLIFQQ